MILISIFLLASEVEHLFVGLFVIQTSSLVKYLFISIAHFRSGFCFFNCGVLSSLYIIDMSPLSPMWFTNIFSQSVAHFFTLLTGSVFNRAEDFNFDEVQFMDFFSCMDYACLRTIHKPKFVPQIFLPMFASKHFIILHFTLKSNIF